MLSKLFNPKLTLQTVLAILITTLATAAIVSATTIGNNISTDGTLTVTGQTTLNGNVGISTTSPSQKLSITGKLYTTGGIQFPDGSLQTAAASAAASSLAGQIAFYNTDGSTVSGTSTITILPSGYVGIGTTSPYAKLSVVGEVVAPYYTATSTIATSTFAGAVRIGQNFWMWNPGNGDSYGDGPNIVMGNSNNYINPNVNSSVIAGGGRTVSNWPNEIADEGASVATISGGYDNHNNALAGTISGGAHNIISNTGDHGTIGGGSTNYVFGSIGTISGGSTNVVGGYGSTVGGGTNNIASSSYTIIAGGQYNTIDSSPVSNYSFIGGGSYNRASSTNTVITGGSSNTVRGSYSSIGGGQSNTINQEYGTIGGGSTNQIIISEMGNITNYGTIGGGYNNVLKSTGSTIAGGSSNTIKRTSGSGSSTIGGGTTNVIDGYANFIGGGASNTASSSSGVIVGGGSNSIIGNGALVDYASILGGLSNSVTSRFGTILGGRLNSVSGDYGLAAGRRAVSSGQGTFVFTDSTDADFTVSTQDTFGARFAGGYQFTGGSFGIGTTTPTANLQVTTSTANATTSVQFGKASQNKGTCLTLYDTNGSPVYAYIAAGAATFTFQNGGTPPSGCKN